MVITFSEARVHPLVVCFECSHNKLPVPHLTEAGVDFVSIGRAAILNHDFPKQMQTDPEFRCRELPVSAQTLHEEGLGKAFVEYMGRWRGFVASEH